MSGFKKKGDEMKKIIITVCLVLMMCCFLGSANATTINIDGSFDSNEWAGYYTDDDGHVGPGVGGQAYDAERLGLYFDSNTVYFGLQTGFDLRNGRDYGSVHFDPGDLALDVNGDGTYDYAIDFTIDTSDMITYSLIDMTGTGIWEDVYYAGHSAAGYPLNAQAGSGLLLSTFAGAFSADNNDLYGHTNSDVIEGSFDISLLSDYMGGSMTLHWTMGCGNDVIEVTTSPVPEPATILLLGAGLIGIAGFGRKRFLK